MCPLIKIIVLYSSSSFPNKISTSQDSRVDSKSEPLKNDYLFVFSFFQISCFLIFNKCMGAGALRERGRERALSVWGEGSTFVAG